MKFLAVIPARYASSRFPGKPLIDIFGQSMVSRVYLQVSACPGIDHTVVATDHLLIFDHCRQLQIPVMMTSGEHTTGTDRVAEVAESYNAEVIINVQGDEPFIPTGHIAELMQLFTNSDVEIGTLVSPIGDPSLASLDSIVKAVCREDGRALYFSRSVIPYIRSSDCSITHYRHLGIYAFRKDLLLKITRLEKGRLEKCEMLEQLRWLEAGYDIYTRIVSEAPLGIDLPEDLDRLKHWWENRSAPD